MEDYRNEKRYVKNSKNYLHKAFNLLIYLLNKK